MIRNQKQSGAYYTPDSVVSTLVQWAVRDKGDRLIDPACGDGRFISEHRNAVGIEQDANAARVAMARAPWALVHEEPGAPAGAAEKNYPAAEEGFALPVS